MIGGADSSGPIGVIPGQKELLHGTSGKMIHTINSYTLYSKPFYCRVARRVCLNGELYSASMPGIEKKIGDTN